MEMSELSNVQGFLQARFKTLAMGMKLMIVCGLALLMCIPAFFVGGLVDERTGRAAEVTREVSGDVGGEQTFLGPTLAIPYTVPAHDPRERGTRYTYLVFPTQARAEVKTATEERHRSLFKVPVFQADLKLDADFDLSGVPANAPEGAVFDWDRAEMVAGVSDPRGAVADATLTANGKTITMAPAQTSGTMTFGTDQGQTVRLVLLGASAAGLAKPDAQFSVSSALKFSGAQRLAVLAYGKTTHLKATGDWPSPGFDGGFLPVSRSVAASGFNAEWTVPFIARGVRAEGESESITGLEATALGISFVEVADPYQSVNRSIKYLPLFLGLVFLTYFLFEATTRKRVHAAQYLLVGVAQIIFYPLLLSLAERIGFDWGFLIARSATVMLLAVNAKWVFASRAQGMRALGIFAPLYALIYALLRLEDNALLVGAVASFLAVAAVMYFTRRIDWYGALPEAGPITSPPRPAGGGIAV
jgi:inner membrane protein